MCVCSKQTKKKKMFVCGLQYTRLSELSIHLKEHKKCELCIDHYELSDEDLQEHFRRVHTLDALFADDDDEMLCAAADNVESMDL